MDGKSRIPETGLEVPVVHTHPIVWTDVIAFVREVFDALAVRTPIINDRFALPHQYVVEVLVSYITHYMLYTHYHLYHRLGLVPAGYTPSRGKVLYSEEVPDFFIAIARHLARPRLLPDGSISLPQLSLPYADGVLYGALPAVGAFDVLRNGVVVGAPAPDLNAIQIAGTALVYRHRVFLSLRRHCDGISMMKLIKREGLMPARLAYWRHGINSFVHFLDEKDEFEKATLDLDCLLRPIVFPDLPAPPVLAGARPAAAGPAQQAWDTAAALHYTARTPPEIQWTGGNLLLGQEGLVTRDEFLVRERAGSFTHPLRTVTFVRAEFISSLSMDLSEFQFPKLGTLEEEVSEFKVLVNDLGKSSPSTSFNRKNARRYKSADVKKPEKQFSGAVKAASAMTGGKATAERKRDEASTSEPAAKAAGDKDTFAEGEPSDRKTEPSRRGRRNPRGRGRSR